MTVNAVPDLTDIRETFEYFTDWEDRYRYVIELGQQLGEMPEADRTEANLVRGCQSQVWLKVIDETTADGEQRLRLRLDSDAFIVKGLAAILVAALDDRTPTALLAEDPLMLFDELQLLNHLSPSRGNGLRAMIDRLQSEAQRRIS